MGHAGLRHPIDARLSSLKSDVSSARRKSTLFQLWRTSVSVEGGSREPAFVRDRAKFQNRAGRPADRPPSTASWRNVLDTDRDRTGYGYTHRQTTKLRKRKKKRREFLLRCSWSVVYVFALAGKERERRHPTRLHVCVGVLPKRRDTSHIPSARSSSCNDHDAVGWRNVRRSGFTLEEIRTFEP